MEFLASLQTHYDKLEDKEIISLLWKSINDGSNKYSEAINNKIYSFSYHLPVDMENFIETLFSKLPNASDQNLMSLESKMKIYLLTLIFYCTNLRETHVSSTTSISAATLYLNLLMLTNNTKVFYKELLYKNVLNILINYQTSQKHADKLIQLMDLLIGYVDISESDDEILRLSVYCFAKNATSSRQVLNFHQLRDDVGIDLRAYRCLSKLISSEADAKRIMYIFDGIFKLLKHNFLDDIPKERSKIVHTNLKNFIKLLHPNLNEVKFSVLLNSLFVIIKEQDFCYYQELVLILNDLNVECYKEFLRKMGLMMQAKNSKSFLTNLFNMMHAMLSSLPRYHETGKLDVLYECVIRSLLMQCMSPTKVVADKAIEILAKICLIKNTIVLAALQNVTPKRSHDYLNINTILSAFKSIIDAKWLSVLRKRDVTTIVCVLLNHSTEINQKIVHDTLQALHWDATAFSLSFCFPLFIEVFISMKMKGHYTIAVQIMGILLKVALDQGSSNILKEIYNLMTQPTVIDGVEFSTDNFTEVLFKEFEIGSIFKLINTQKLIRKSHIDKLMLNLNYTQTGNLHLLGALTKYYFYDDSRQIMDYIQYNSNVLVNHENTMLLFMIFANMLKSKTHFTNEEREKLKSIYGFLKQALIKQAFPVPVIQSAFSLLNRLQELLFASQDNSEEIRFAESLHKVYLENINKALEKYDIKPIMYGAEYILQTKKEISGQVLMKLAKNMENPEFRSAIQQNHPGFWVPLIVLLTNSAFKNKRFANIASVALKDSLKSRNVIHKTSSIQLLRTLCVEITHDFQDVIEFAFEEICSSDICLIRICAMIIEHLVYNDYLKLSSEQYFKFISPLGYSSLNVFMKDLLSKRFISNNSNVVTRHFVTSMVFASNSFKNENYYISTEFAKEIDKISPRLENKRDMYIYLFKQLPQKSQFNVLVEVTRIFDDIISSSCHFEENSIELINDFIYLFKYTCSDVGSHFRPSSYDKAFKVIEKQIINHDTNYKPTLTFERLEQDIHHMTCTLLKLLFCKKDISRNFERHLFDTIVLWIDYVKAEIIHHIHIERGKDYKDYFNKLISYYHEKTSSYYRSSPAKCEEEFINNFLK